jgi:DNA-binding transcriptional ArsR family regulator
MAIRFRIADAAAEQVAFAYSPLLEAVLSLHVLTEPKHHAAQHAFVRQARRLSIPLKREIAAFSFAYRSYFPGFLYPTPTGEFGSFTTELDALAAIPDDLVTLEFTRPLYGGTLPRDPRLLVRPEVRSTIVREADTLSPESRELIRLALDAPQVLLDRFRQLMEYYWAECFEDEWARLDPQLAEAVIEAGRTIAGRRLFAHLVELAPEVRVDREEQCFWLERPHEHDVTVVPPSHLVLSPSFFVWPHVRVNCDQPWSLALVYPAPGIARAVQSPLPPRALLQVLRALGDETRLRILHLIVERPRSTQELASLLHLSEAAISKQLRVLTEATLLVPRRDGYYVLYALAPDRIAVVSPSLAAFLRQSPMEEGFIR